MESKKAITNTGRVLARPAGLPGQLVRLLAAIPALVIGLAMGWTNGAVANPAQNCPALLNHTLPRLQDEQPQNLCQYAGKVVLAVNTASACGYTPQYEGLQKLHERYASRGLVIMGFPSSDFRQEPKDNKGIAEQCFDVYGVRFPMFAKSGVVGQTANPFFAALTRETGEAPKWNFHKYLIDRQGRAVASFPSAVDPLDRRLTSRIEQLLATR
jgi:glutathione peroxidase